MREKTGVWFITAVFAAIGAVYVWAFSLWLMIQFNQVSAHTLIGECVQHVPCVVMAFSAGPAGWALYRLFEMVTTG